MNERVCLKCRNKPICKWQEGFEVVDKKAEALTLTLSMESPVTVKALCSKFEWNDKLSFEQRNTLSKRRS